MATAVSVRKELKLTFRLRTHVVQFKVQQTVREMSKQEETSKAVIQRRQGGAVVSASNSSVRKKPPKKALDEDEFTDVSIYGSHITSTS